MVAADSLTMYLDIFQERLGCISHGHQEGAIQTTGKCFQSTYSEIQTCCNVAQSNLSDSGLEGHLVRWIKGLERQVFYVERNGGTEGKEAPCEDD